MNKPLCSPLSDQFSIAHWMAELNAAPCLARFGKYIIHSRENRTQSNRSHDGLEYTYFLERKINDPKHNSVTKSTKCKINNKWTRRKIGVDTSFCRYHHISGFSIFSDSIIISGASLIARTSYEIDWRISLQLVMSSGIMSYDVWRVDDKSHGVFNTFFLL